jgi:hypothetical protein
MDTQMDDEVPILDEENYSTWIIEMKVHLKEIGAGCLESNYWWISSFEEQVKVCSSKGRKEE